MSCLSEVVSILDQLLLVSMEGQKGPTLLLCQEAMMTTLISEIVSHILERVC